MLQALIDGGVTVEVCAIYLPGLGADGNVLIKGVGVAQPPATAGAMLADDANVWSFRRKVRPRRPRRHAATGSNPGGDGSRRGR